MMFFFLNLPMETDKQTIGIPPLLSDLQGIRAPEASKLRRHSEAQGSLTPKSFQDEQRQTSYLST